VSLRRAEPADASAIRELSRAAYAKWIPVIGSEPGRAIVTSISRKEAWFRALLLWGLLEAGHGRSFSFSASTGGAMGPTPPTSQEALGAPSRAIAW
jgi:hypothetical protein